MSLSTQRKKYFVPASSQSALKQQYLTLFRVTKVCRHRQQTTQPQTRRPAQRPCLNSNMQCIYRLSLTNLDFALLPNDFQFSASQNMRSRLRLPFNFIQPERIEFTAAFKEKSSLSY